MRSPTGAITRQIELSRYGAMLAAYDAQIRNAEPGTVEHAEAWRDRTTYAALNHPDHPPAWMSPEHPDFGRVPEAVTAELNAQAATLAAAGTREAEVG